MAEKQSNGAAEPAGIGDNSLDIPAVVRAYFEDIFKINEEIAKKMQRHIEPLRKRRLKFYRDLKTATGINRKAIDAEYALFVIAKEAMGLEDEDHRDKVLDDLRTLHESLHPGGQADWIAALELAAKTEMPDLPK